MIDRDCINRVRHAVIALSDYCKKNNWAGYDPYDALNSRLFAWTPFSSSRICRIAATQILKRLPINIRPLLLIDKEENPKAIALFLIAYLKLAKLGFRGNGELATTMAERLVGLRSKDTPYWCWGYSFPWQTRTILVAKGYPNLVCTTFVANALLDAYDANGEARYLEMARSAAEYVVNELYWEEGDAVGFSYPLPSVKSRIHNANFLGAALLCRVARVSGEKKYLGPALKAARYSAARQHDDGSWDYGELPTDHWVDNFHTGYNLCALRAIREHTGTSEFDAHVRKGFEFYRKYFFREDGAGTGNASPIATWLRQGRKDYLFGNHPLWEVFRTLYQITRRPYVLGGAFLLAGYARAGLKGETRPISTELIRFIRGEQMERLKKKFLKVSRGRESKGSSDTK